LEALHEAMCKESPGYELLSTVDRCLFPAKELLFNKISLPHVDRGDPHLGWVALVALGNFKGGPMELPELGLRIRYEPGDVVFLRGRVVQHQVIGSWVGQRISIPHFAHSSLWKAFGIEDVFVNR
jgi:hypothetical protein